MKILVWIMPYIQHCSNDLASAELCSKSWCRVDATRHREALTEKKKKSKRVLDEYNLLVGKHGGLA